MRYVWKAPLRWPADVSIVQLPRGAELLTVAKQGESLCLWALCDPDQAPASYEIRTCGTGHPVDDYHGKYLGTWQEAGGELVFHAFGLEIGRLRGRR